MERLSTITTGLVFGAMMGGMHLIWSLLVAAGWGQWIMNFIFWIYFIKPIDLIEPFESTRAISLVVTTSIMGFMLGWAAARLWNRLRAWTVGLGYRARRGSEEGVAGMMQRKFSTLTNVESWSSPRRRSKVCSTY